MKTKLHRDFLIHFFTKFVSLIFFFKKLGLQPSRDTPYEKGVFKLEIEVGERYPNEPPKIKFLTPIYHPNIDDAGRICINTLKNPPHGVFSPGMTLGSLLTSIQILLSNPNPNDPLMEEICAEYKSNYSLFLEKARKMTEKYAVDKNNVTLNEKAKRENNQLEQVKEAEKVELEKVEEKKEESVKRKLEESKKEEEQSESQSEQADQEESDSEEYANRLIKVQKVDKK